MSELKYCENCGNKVHFEAVICPNCGHQLQELKTDLNNKNPQIIINNSNVINRIGGHECNKWIALILCFFLGVIGAHKFYEGKIGLGIIYIFTMGLFGIGWFVDLIVILFRPEKYYV